MVVCKDVGTASAVRRSRCTRQVVAIETRSHLDGGVHDFIDARQGLFGLHVFGLSVREETLLRLPHFHCPRALLTETCPGNPVSVSAGVY